MLITCLDDDPRLELLLHRLLDRLGYELRFDCSVLDFKSGLAETVPDLVLLDLGLGQDSGIDVIHWLADRAFKPPIALLSACGDSLLDTSRRIAEGRDISVLGIVSKARLAQELLPVLERLHRSPGSDHTLSRPIAPQEPAPARIQRPEPSLDAGSLRSLIAAGAVLPYLQPIVDPADGTLHGAETLCRLCLPDGRILGAADFIPLAEAHDLLFPITKTLCHALMDQQQRLAPLRLEFIAINLSASCLIDQHVVDLVQSLVNGLNNTCALHVEITETACCLSAQQAQSLAARIELAGAQLAIDDFGTGYSSMRVLAELPFETLKIDLSFVTEMFDSPKALRLLRAIIRFGKSLGMQLVAEGVETEAQRKFLAAEGVQHAQGFLFGAPMPIDAFIETYTTAVS